MGNVYSFFTKVSKIMLQYLPKRLEIEECALQTLYSGVLKMSYNYTRVLEGNHIRNLFKKSVSMSLRSFQLVIIVFFLPLKDHCSFGGQIGFWASTFGCNFCHDFLKHFLKIEKMNSFVGMQFLFCNFTRL